VQGAVVHTLSRGTHLWADGDLRAESGRGRYLGRAAFGHPYQAQTSSHP
jgi:dihydropyrimidinase